LTGKAIRVRGTVQGVGFRPFIWHLARQYGLKGSVWNDEQGVMIHAWGESQLLQNFIKQISLHTPPLAKILSINSTELYTQPEINDFQIRISQHNTTAQTPITADAATCPECLAEIQDPSNRRYRYPFTNCTHCGPRLSIIRRIPYDRYNTSMDIFPMCAACQAEYETPVNRRFHAQANCCADCGPELWLENALAEKISVTDAIKHAADLIKQGHIVAIKGLGGFHLACDATNESAVARLRQRKKRYGKAFALMAKNITAIKDYAQIDNLEQQALTDNSAAILILDAKAKKLAASVAINDDKLGFMLPYTPVHSLLLQQLEHPVVMTSGNISDEPQCINNQQARQKLQFIADYFLMHNRNIVNRLDDSVARKLGDNIHLLRRARGFSPEVLKLPDGFSGKQQILAMGAELKNSFCLIKNGLAIVSQHMGDLENAETQRDYRHQLELYQHLFDFKAEVIAVDLHPNYLSTQYGQQLTRSQDLPIHSVQHHHAHVAACMAEHGLTLDTRPVLAAVFDGLGLGLEGQLWGGEFLLSDYLSCKRLGHFQPITMPGGVQSIYEPWRSAYAQLNYYFDFEQIRQDYKDLEVFRLLETKPLALLTTMMEKNLNSPLSSSCGRWFDAFAAVLGICSEQMIYEGQAAIMFETLAATEFDKEANNAYGYTLIQQQENLILNWKVLWHAVLKDLQRQTNKAVIAARIHHTLVNASVELLINLSERTCIDRVVLSGGVFQNRLLLSTMTQRLQQHGKMVLTPCLYPINDGGVSLGQAVIAAAISEKNYIEFL
jgi:hydrogenase maturation protein HypF